MPVPAARAIRYQAATICQTITRALLASPFLQAQQGLDGQHFRRVDEPSTVARMSRGKLGDYLAHALQRVVWVPGKVVPGNWPDDSDPRHSSPVGCCRQESITDSNRKSYVDTHALSMP
jgi:hypothetical protein